MIKAGITGGDSTAAGHLIRILINHPDVEIVWVEAPSEEGELIARHHRGLTGETYMSFCAKGNPEEVNVIFLCNSEDGDSERYMRHTPIPEGGQGDRSFARFPLARGRGVAMGLCRAGT